MIFLRNISLTVFLTAILIMLTGCSTELSLVSGPDSPAETTIATIEPVTEAPLPDISNLESADGIYVYDNIGVLNSEPISQLNNYCEKLYKERLINTAVVISDNI